MEEASSPATAKRRLIAIIQAGHPWHQAATMAGIQVGRSAAYHLLRKFRLQGEAALQDGRHGHPAKLRQSVRQWLETTCREAPHTESCCTNRPVRAVRHPGQHWASQPGAGRTGRRQPCSSPEKNLPFPCSSEEPHWQEGAGGLLLVAAAEATCLLSTLEAAVSSCSKKADSRVAHLSCASRRRFVLTLLFLGAVGLRRTWDLRGYTGDALALLSGRQRAYGYFHMERLLSLMVQANEVEKLPAFSLPHVQALTSSASPKGDGGVGVLRLAHAIDRCRVREIHCVVRALLHVQAATSRPGLDRGVRACRRDDLHPTVEGAKDQVAGKLRRPR
jgi:hypothetical protein